MDLWTEFEGVTIDSAYALNKLLQTEGRSAFFSTFNARGESVLIRIIECHFDEDEILARWRGVQTLGHANFLRIDRFGQFLIEEDGITAVYAVFERVDANLGQVLERGRLSAADTAQIGMSIASALETLHANGFVHEHVEARNIFAVGETVKMRSDCVRETPEGEDGIAARRRDVHDLAVVLMQVLAGAPRFSHTTRETLPAPFDDIVRNGMSGEWGLDEIKRALAAGKTAKTGANGGARGVGSVTRAATQAATAPGLSELPPKSSTPQMPAEAELPVERPERTERSERTGPVIFDAAARTVFPRDERDPLGLRTRALRLELPVRRWMVAGALLMAAVLLGWMVVLRLSGRPAAPSQGTAATHTATAPLPALHASASQQAFASPEASQPLNPARWRVVAFTYNRKDQAEKKSSSLARRNPALRPEVFSPTGKAPWLVTVGGAMQRDAAYTLAHKAQGLGLPRDTYAQNYTAR